MVEGNGIKNFWMATLLIAGTSIGAGMLALPTVTGLAGFLPAMAVNFVCWLFMFATGLLFLEAILWMPPGANLLTTAHRFLGKAGLLIGGGTFVFLYYCLLVAYLSGGAPILVQILGGGISYEVGLILFSLLFGGIVLWGAGAVNRVNWLLMWGLIGAYVLLVALGAEEVQSHFLERSSWKMTFYSIPILFAAYGYHNVVPSVTMHLKKNAKRLRLSILVGTLIPFVVYSIWQWLVIGTFSEDELRLMQIQGIPVTSAFQEVTHNIWVKTLGRYFGFFALVTSFLGVSLSMTDFFADALHASRKGVSRFLLSLLIFTPPVLFASWKPDVFIKALEIAGGFGEAILNGLFPILMVWVGRYWVGLDSDWQLPGGRVTLFILALFVTVIIGLEIQKL